MASSSLAQPTIKGKSCIPFLARETATYSFTKQKDALIFIKVKISGICDTARVALIAFYNGVSPSGKAQIFDICTRMFNSFNPNHFYFKVKFMYGVTDNCIRKWCKNIIYHIILPIIKLNLYMPKSHSMGVPVS